MEHSARFDIITKWFIGIPIEDRSYDHSALGGIAAVLDGRAKKIGDSHGYNRYTRLPSGSIMITSWSCHALRWDLPNPGEVNTDSSVHFSPGSSLASSCRCCSSLEIGTR